MIVGESGESVTGIANDTQRCMDADGRERML